MGEGSSVLLRDEVGGETIDLTLDPELTVGDVITARVTAADHPRADFRGRTLTYRLVDGDGTVIPAEEVVGASRSLPPGTEVFLRSPEAADIKERRDRWLAEIEAEGFAQTSITPTTHLALIERTRSRLADAERLRDQLLAARQQRSDQLLGNPGPAPPAAGGDGAGGSPSRRRTWLLAVGIGALALVLVAAAGLALVLVRSGSDGGSAAEEEAANGVRGGGGDVTLPAELELELEPGTTDETTFTGAEGQDITILMLATGNGVGRRQPLDPELVLLDADGNQIAHNDDRLDLQGRQVGVGGLNSRIDITLPADGVYTVLSRDLSGSAGGLYTLVIEEGGPGGDGGSGFAPADRPDTTTEAFEMEAEGPMPEQVGCGHVEPVEVELPHHGPIDIDCTIHTLIFTVTDEPTLLLIGAQSPGQGEGDPVVWLYREGHLLGMNDDAGSLNSHLEIEVEAGTYELQVGNLTGNLVPVTVTIEPG